MYRKRKQKTLKTNQNTGAITWRKKGPGGNNDPKGLVHPPKKSKLATQLTVIM
jgi:hypothetical protein